jgi:autotransporter-associated beta strand protein
MLVMKKALSLSLLTCVSLLATSALAVTNFTWTGASSSSYGILGNWTVDVPSPGTAANRAPSAANGDDAVIFQGGVTARTIDMSSTARNVRGVTFNSVSGANGFTFNVSALVATSSSFGFNLRPDGIVNNDDSVQTFNVPVKLFSYAGTTPNVSFTFNNTLAGGGLTFSGAWTGGIAGKETVNMNGATGLIIDGVASTTTTIGTTGGGILSGTGSKLTKNGAGNLVLGGTAANTYTGGTEINAGGVTLNKANALGTGALTVNGGTLDLQGNSQTVAAVTLAGGTINGAAGVLTGTGYTLKSGTINAKLGGAVAVAKTTAGLVTLGGANTYSGNTTISAGTLALSGSGSIANSPNIILAGGTLDVSGVTGGFSLLGSQTLKGNGNVAGGVTANGTLSPGASIGTLTLNSTLTLAATANTIMEISHSATPQNADLISATSIALGGTLTISDIGSGGFLVGDAFDLFDGALSSGFVTINGLPTLNPSMDWDATGLGSGGDGVLRIVSVPEPSTIACLGLGLALISVLRRRK